MPEKEPQGIWIDTDVALGARSGDVDDGFAVAFVIRAAQKFPERFKVLGISAVSGNTDGQTAYRCTRTLLERLDASSVPAVKEEDAAAAMTSLDVGTSILTIGPPTNVVRAIELEPELAPRVEVRAVGTVLNRRRHPILPFFCLNFRTAPGASQRFFKAPFRRRVIFPLDVVKRLAIGQKHLDELSGLSALGRYMSVESKRWLRQAPFRYAARRFPVWDLVAGMDAVDMLEETQWISKGGQARALSEFSVDRAWRRFLEILK